MKGKEMKHEYKLEDDENHVYYRDNMYSPGFQPFVMGVEAQKNDTFFVWIAGEVGHRHVTRRGLEQLRDNPVLSRKLKDGILAALAA